MFELTPDSVVRVAHCIVVAVKIDPSTMIMFDWMFMVSAPAPMVSGEPPWMFETVIVLKSASPLYWRLDLRIPSSL